MIPGKGLFSAINTFAADRDYRPALGFFFRAGLMETMAFSTVSEVLGGSGGTVDNRFQEISGLSFEIKTEEIKEGGQNEYVYKVPLRASYGNLVLKRGLLVKDTQLAEWCFKVIKGGLSKRIIPRTLFVELMDPSSMIPLMGWSVNNAFPVKWSVSDFNAKESAIVVETLEFAFTDISTLKTDNILTTAAGAVGIDVKGMFGR